MTTSRIIGNYELGPKIGAGGMADIHLAIVRGTGDIPKALCIKLLQPHRTGDPEFKKMFEDEAALAGMLAHPNVVQVIDCGRDGETFYIAMEYVFGRDLRAVVDRAASRQEPIGYALAARICRDAARGLSAAHRLVDVDKVPLHVVHRDVSPQNILLSFAGEVKLTDFGISRLKRADAKTSPGVAAGKPGYLSPEQARGEALDARTDVFSLGIVLWELLAGERLFKPAGEGATHDALLNGELPRPSSKRFVPADLEVIAMKALSRNRDDRHADAVELADALADFLGRLTHDYGEQSVERFMARLYPEERLAPPAGQPLPPAPVSEPVASHAQPSGSSRRRTIAVTLAAAAAVIAIAAAAFLYHPQASPVPMSVATPPPTAVQTQPAAPSMDAPPARLAAPIPRPPAESAYSEETDTPPSAPRPTPRASRLVPPHSPAASPSTPTPGPTSN